MNSKQGARYIKRRMGNDLKQKILVYNGIVQPRDIEKKPSVLSCSRCTFVNAVEYKYCSKCAYPLIPSAFFLDIFTFAFICSLVIILYSLRIASVAGFIVFNVISLSVS